MLFRSREIVVLSLSETKHPEAIRATLDELQHLRPDWDIHMIALVDDRMCACFPRLRREYEDYADLTLQAPFDVNEVVQKL